MDEPGTEESGVIHDDFNYTDAAIQSYISDLIADLKYPMTSNLLAARLAELREWFERLRELEAIDVETVGRAEWIAA